MKILAINAGSAVSGAEKVLFDLCQYSLGLGDEITLASPAGAITEDAPAEIAQVSIPHQIPSANPTASRLRSAVSTALIPVTWLRTAIKLLPHMRRADVVLVNSTFALPAVSLAALRTRTHISWLVHDTIVRRKQQIAVALSTRAVNTVVAVSNPTADALHQWFPDALVRPNGVEIPAPEFFDRQAALRRPDMERPVVGILASITHWKGQDVLIRAAKLLEQRGVDITVEIAGGVFPGSESYAQTLRELVDELDVGERVRFLGHVSRDDVFAHWNVMVSASRMPEAGPLGVLEAMAHRVPVIATALGGSVDYLSDDRGILCAPDDPQALVAALEKFFGDPEAAQRYAERGFDTVSAHYRLQQTVPAMWEALRARED